MSDKEKNQQGETMSKEKMSKETMSNNANSAAEEIEDVIEVVSEENAADDEEGVQDPQLQVEQLTKELAAEREKYLRVLADMDNLRKRCRRDIEEARLSGRANVLEELLPALDSMDMALKSIEPNEANQAVFDGMIMVQKQFMASMERFELKPVQSREQKFDPSIHEAVSYVPSPVHESGEIIDEMRAGYTLGNRLLRAAMVVVSSGQPPEIASEASTDVTNVNDGNANVDSSEAQDGSSDNDADSHEES